MLKISSYFNIIFAVLYFLMYLQNGSSWMISALLMVVVFNWIVLRDLEIERLKWTFFHWVLAGITLAFALYLSYSSILLLLDAVEYHYYVWNNVLLISSGLCFAAVILFQLLFSWSQFQIKKSD
jgi:hypothetical protein